MPIGSCRRLLRVLLVDDEPTIRVTLGDELADHGHTVVCESDGSAGLRRLADGPFDAVISDLRLPGQSGFEVLAAARLANPVARLLLVTAVAPVGLRAKLADVGGSWLGKPFANAEVLAWLDCG